MPTSQSVDLKQSLGTESNEAMSPKEGAAEGAEVKSEVEEAAAEEETELKESLRQESSEPIGSKALLEPYRKIIA